MTRPAIYQYACDLDFEGEPAECWLAQFDTTNHRCEGRMDPAHLIERQRLRKEGYAELVKDPRTWKPACRFHHSAWDNYRGLTVPREAVPEELEALCEGIGLGWALTRRFGERTVAA